MRALPTRVQDLIRSGEYAVHARVRIEDPDGSVVVVGYGDADQGAWLVSVEYGEDLDQPVSDAVVRLRRSVEDLSLAPLMEDSALNRDASGAYAPRVDVARRIVIETQVTAPWEEPIDSAWQNVFEGVVDRVEWSGPEVTLYCRDLGALLVDRWVEQETTYGDPEGGEPLEAVAQAILDDWAPGVTLYAPDSPGFQVTQYRVGEQSVMDALETLAQKIGWAIRYRYDSGSGTWRLTLYEPDRSATTPQWTFGPDDYLDVTELEIDRDLIRNVVEVEYLDSVSGERKTVVAEDPVSIARYGRKWMKIIEADDSPIDTEAEAQAMADAAVADIAWPEAEQQIETLYLPVAEIGDLYRFRANGVHYDRDHDWAVASVRHSLALDRQQTTIRTRGKPAGMYRQWFRASSLPPGPPTAAQLPPRALLRILEYTDLFEAVVQITGVAGGMGAAPPTQYRWREYREGDTPGNYSDWLSLDGNRQATVTVARRPKGNQIVEAQVRTDSGLESDPVTVRVAPTDGWQDDETGGPKWSFIVDDDGGQSALINEARSKGQNLLPPNAWPEVSFSGVFNKWFNDAGIGDAPIGIPLDDMGIGPGDTVVLSGRVRSSAGGRVALQTQFYNSAGAVVGSILTADVTATAYTLVSATGTVPSNAVTCATRVINRDFTANTAFSKQVTLNRGTVPLIEPPPFRPHRETADVIRPGNTKALIHAAYVDELGRPWLLYDPDTGRDIDVGDIVNPPSISGITLAVEDDGFADHYTLEWTASANMSSAWSVRAQFFREGVLRGTRTEPATNEVMLFTDIGAGDGQPNMHSATLELLNDSQQVVATINSPVVISITI